MMRQRTFLLIALVLVSTVFAGVGAAAAAGTNVQIRSVDLSVDQPAPGERFTLTADVASLQSSSGPVKITDIYVRKAGSTEEYARVENVGTVAAGGSLAVPLTMRIDEPGQKQLTVHLVVKDESGSNHRVNYPLYVDVGEPDEAVISFGTLDPIAGQQGPVNVTVSNGDSAALTSVQLQVGGDAGSANPERVTASLPAGMQVTHTFQTTFPSAGAQSLTATLQYTTHSGATRTIERTIEVDTDQPTVDTTFSAAVERANGSSVIRPRLGQFGNAELREVKIRAVQNGETVARTTMPDVGPDGSRIVSLDSSTIPSGPVDVVATFTAAGERRSVSQRLNYTSDVQLNAENQVLNGSSVVRAELTQFGHVELRDVKLRVRSNGKTVARASAPNVLSGSSRSVVLRSEEIPAGDVTVVATYTAGRERRSTETTLRYAQYSPAPTSAISLTGIEVSREGNTVTLRGDAANVGTAAVNSVVISVDEADGVKPASPNDEYFIDSIQPSAFENFQAMATAPAGLDELPLRIEYTVGGQRVATVVAVDVVERDVQSTNAGGSGDDGGFSGLLLGLLLLTVLGGAGVAYWRLDV